MLECRFQNKTTHHRVRPARSFSWGATLPLLPLDFRLSKTKKHDKNLLYVLLSRHYHTLTDGFTPALPALFGNAPVHIAPLNFILHTTDIHIHTYTHAHKHTRGHLSVSTEPTGLMVGMSSQWCSTAPPGSCAGAPTWAALAFLVPD